MRLSSGEGHIQSEISQTGVTAILMAKIMDSWLAYYEFDLKPLKSHRAEASVKDSNVNPFQWHGSNKRRSHHR
ncbi:hypothetical protein TNCV_4330511 [Trichonephila clavipes]|nr:hypothetical protein TNCV_4330511 [Trichonephila clavipes]